MKIAMIQRMPHEFFGVMHLSSVIKKAGHRCEAFITDLDRARLCDNIRRFAPDLMAFPLASYDYRWFKDCVSRIRRYGLDMPVMVGGPHATFFPDMIEEDDVDYLFRGEAEDSLEEFLRVYGDRGQVQSLKGVWSKGDDGRVFRNEVRPLRQDLDALPFPDRSIYYDKYGTLKMRSDKRFFTSRGCPYQCSFCHNAALQKLYEGKGAYIRRFSPERVIREIQEMRARYVLQIVSFVDDLFCHDAQWLTEFLGMYAKEIRLPFRCYVRADVLNEELLQALKEAGLYSVAFGIESGNEKIRFEILNKRIKDEEISRCAGLLHKWGVPFTTFNMFATPTETLEDAFKTVELNIRIKTDFPAASILIPYPMTEMTCIARKLNHLPENFDFVNLPSSFFRTSPLELTHKYVFENIQKVFYFAVRYPFSVPLFKKLVRIKFPQFFNMLFYLSTILRYARERSLRLSEAARIYWQLRRSY